MCKPNIKCEVCGKEFYKKPFRIKKDVNHTCSMECLGKLRHLTKVRLIESKFDMPIKELLYDLYIVKKLPTRKVGEIIGLSKGKVSEWLKKYDIEVRYGSEAIETQWINNSERRKNNQMHLLKILTLLEITLGLKILKNIERRVNILNGD